MFQLRTIEDFLPNKRINQIAHYTKIGNLCHFLPEGSSNQTDGSDCWSSAWATCIRFLNDRQELDLGLHKLNEMLERLTSPLPLRNKYNRIRIVMDDLMVSTGELLKDTYQMSFSGNLDDLGQWRGYGANGMGCAVVTSKTEVYRVADIAGWVIYSPQQQEIFATSVLNSLVNETDSDEIKTVLTASASFMKHDGFSSEMEYRMIKFPSQNDIKFRESGDRIVPYIVFLNHEKRLPILKIILGPGWQLSSMKATDAIVQPVNQGIYRLLEFRKVQQVPIEYSRIPYDPK